MKLQINLLFMLILATFILPSSSFAQNISTTSAPKDNSMSNSGFRISLLRPNLSARYKARLDTIVIEETKKVDSSTGVEVGYAQMPSYGLGWTANVSLVSIKSEETAKIGRIDGNLSYIFNRVVNVKGGANVSKFTSGEVFKDFNSGLGLQASVGLQFSKNFGLDLGYVEMNSSGMLPLYLLHGEIGKADTKLKIFGTEVAIHATF